MNFLRNKTLWYSLYGVLITLVFCYLLFPSDLAKNKLEEAARSSGLTLKVDSVRAAFPFGLKAKNVAVGTNLSPTPYFQGQWMDLQFNPWNLFQKSKNIRIRGQAYGGDFSGRFRLASLSRLYPPEEGTVHFENLDLNGFEFIKKQIGRAISGRGTGQWMFAYSPDKRVSGSFELVLKNGFFALQEPFLGLSRMDFRRAEISGTIKNGRIKFEKIEWFGPQMDCFLNGEMEWTDDFKNGELQLTGEMVIAEKKVKMKISVGGTLANPSIRYI